jgi:AFG3 family protein
MCSALAGRAAEEIVFGKISTGAINDLEKVTKQSMAMVMYFGMSELIGNISYYDSSGQSEYSFSKPYSEKTAEIIDKEIKAIIDIQYIRAKKVLQENFDGLSKLAEQLLEKEVIFSEDLEAIFGKRKEKNPNDLINEKRARLKEEEEKFQEKIEEKENDDIKDKTDNNNEND